ncbi:MAG: HAD family phosphatase [Betaproteobacteria bacterium]
MIERWPVAVIFDMDGLMLDTEAPALRAWKRAALALGREFDLDLCQQMIGRNFGDCVALIRARHGADYPVDALTQAWVADYDAIVAAEGISLKPGLDEILDLLDERGIAAAVATSTRRERARAKLDRVGLLHRFAALVGGDEVAHGKPAPDIFIAAAARLGVPARDCLVLEDSEPGIIAAAAAGMIAVMVPDLHAPSAALLARKPVVLASLSAVAAHLRAIGA